MPNSFGKLATHQKAMFKKAHFTSVTFSIYNLGILSNPFSRTIETFTVYHLLLMGPNKTDSSPSTSPNLGKWGFHHEHRKPSFVFPQNMLPDLQALSDTERGQLRPLGGRQYVCTFQWICIPVFSLCPFFAFQITSKSSGGLLALSITQLVLTQFHFTSENKQQPVMATLVIL